MTLLPCGPLAVMVEVDSTARAAAVAAAASGLPGVVDVVGGARSVLVTAASDAARLDIEQWLLSLGDDVAATPRGGSLVEVPVVYDGPDLADVAAAAGLTTAEVIELHSAPTYSCAFIGFAPGFAYLTGVASALQLPRRGSPRPRVDAGSVAIGAEFTGVYPSASPGGWHVLGRTTTVMWDAGRDRPALIEPGDTVRFIPS